MNPSPSDLSEFMNRNGQMRGWSAPSWLLANLTTTHGQTPDRGDGLFVPEGELVGIVLSGADPDDGLTFSGTDLPEGASLSADTFSWTPGYDLQGQMFSMTFTISDGTGSASRTVHLFVEDVNRPVAIDAVQPPAGVVISSMGSTVKFTTVGSQLVSIKWSIGVLSSKRLVSIGARRSSGGWTFGDVFSADCVGARTLSD